MAATDIRLELYMPQCPVFIFSVKSIENNVVWDGYFIMSDIFFPLNGFMTCSTFFTYSSSSVCCYSDMYCTCCWLNDNMQALICCQYDWSCECDCQYMFVYNFKKHLNFPMRICIHYWLLHVWIFISQIDSTNLIITLPSLQELSITTQNHVLIPWCTTEITSFEKNVILHE